MHLLFSKVVSAFMTSIAIKTDIKVPSLLSNILDQSMTPTRPVQIYMNVGVSLLRFKYLKILQKALVEMQ